MIGATAAKRYSGKVILSLAVFMWSLSTFITPFFAESLSILVFLRVILGIGEGLGESSCNLEYYQPAVHVWIQCILDMSACNMKLEHLTLCSPSLAFS